MHQDAAARSREEATAHKLLKGVDFLIRKLLSYRLIDKHYRGEIVMNELLEIVRFIPIGFLGWVGLRMSGVLKPDRLEQLNK